jgi:hypothetical protein
MITNQYKQLNQSNLFPVDMEKNQYYDNSKFYEYKAKEKKNLKSIY